MALDLRGRTAVVTGSSKGIGYAIAEALARANANVVVQARRSAEVAEAARRLDEVGEGKVLGIPGDVSRIADVRHLVSTTVDELGGLDILVNNAGFGAFAPVGEIEPETWDRLIGTNLSGVFYCCHEAIPHLAKSKDAWIINIASLAGKNPFAGGAAYNASKFGLVGFSEALMLDVRQQGIRVNYIMPGSVNTYFNDAAPTDADAWKIQPEDIAQVVMDLLALPANSLVSRVEMRPSRPPKR
ncbi:MAG TPA: SDR family oxidoreductase [Longimicrobium sp.]|jgi:NAD(P)-dependent dehydrogenase (short-subunit alcohol dehydrogenase family)